LDYVLLGALIGVASPVVLPLLILVALFGDKTPKIERMIKNQLRSFDCNTRDLDFDATAERTMLNIELVRIGL
jgi:hypothetical protein